MNRSKKQLTLRRETLRDLTAHNAGDVKAGKKGGNKQTQHKTCDCCSDSWYVCDYTVNCW